jgi:hypothetical protein
MTREDIHRAVRVGIAAATARQAIAESPKDTRPRFTAGPLRGRLRDPKARFREEWGSDEEIQALLKDPLVPESIKADCRTATNWYLENHAIGDRDAASEAQRQAELRAIGERAGLDPDRFVAEADYREANRDRVRAVLELVPLTETVNRQADALQAALESLPPVVEPGELESEGAPESPEAP